MSERHVRASKLAHPDQLCPHCQGTGRVSAPTRSAAGRKGGNQNVINARRGVKKDGSPAMSMSERSKLARRYKRLTIANIEDR